MTQFRVRIGINPISWSNDDLPSLGGDTPLETALREGAEIGYEGFELGNKFPKTPQGLKDKLAEFGVACVSGWYSATLAHGSVEAEKTASRAHMEKLAFNGCNRVVYGEVAGSVQGKIDSPLSRRPQFSSPQDWKDYAAKLNQFGGFLQSEFGITLAYHHHMGAYVESPSDIDRLMELTDERVGLLFDSGHAFFGGAAEPVEVLRKHIARTVHVHCKNVRRAVIARARNEQWSFLNSVLNGAFTVPGDGDASGGAKTGLDFAPIIACLKQAKYQGWLVVEAEQDPAVAPSYQYAQIGYRHLKGLVS